MCDARFLRLVPCLSLCYNTSLKHGMCVHLFSRIIFQSLQFVQTFIQFFWEPNTITYFFQICLWQYVCVHQSMKKGQRKEFKNRTVFPAEKSNDFLAKMVFCFINFSDLLREKIVLVIVKNVWDLRLKAENFAKFWGHLNNLFE